MNFVFFNPRGERVRILLECKHAAGVAVGVVHVGRNIALANTCNDLVLRSRGRFHISVHLAFVHASNAGKECADIAASWGMKVSSLNVTVPLFGLIDGLWFRAC